MAEQPRCQIKGVYFSAPAIEFESGERAVSNRINCCDVIGKHRFPALDL